MGIISETRRIPRRWLLCSSNIAATSAARRAGAAAREMVRLSVLVCLSLALPVVRAQKNYAVAKVLGSAAGSSITGTVKFEQDASAALGDMTVTYDIKNMPPSPPQGFGFHVHQYGDTRITDKLTTMAAHFVPFMICEDPDDTTCQDDAVHGLPPNSRRQPGDMGNIPCPDALVGCDDTSAGGDVSGTLVIGQQKMSLTDSMRSIVGRVIVIHSGTAPHPNPNPPANRNLKQNLGGTTPQP